MMNIRSWTETWRRHHVCKCHSCNWRTKTALSSKCHFSCFHACDGRQDESPCSPPSSTSFDGRHLALKAEEVEEGITCNLLIKLHQSQNKAAGVFLPSRRSFISCVAGNCLSTRLISRRRRPSFIDQPSLRVLLKWRLLCVDWWLTVIHSAPPAHTEQPVHLLQKRSFKLILEMRREETQNKPPENLKRERKTWRWRFI